MFRKSPETQPFPQHEFEDRLDQLLAAARKAGVTASGVADLLKRRAEAFAIQDALSVNCGGSPSVTFFDGHNRALPR
jgi:hypothetical protein